jgi:AcrR family transcriptional regulator
MTKLGNARQAGSSSPRRKRRSTDEIIERIIDAAFFEFGQNGYSGTTTAAIARRADVTEPLIFTHFGSKANLFRKAVFKPLDDHFAQFNKSLELDTERKGDRESESRAFVSDLVGFIRRHSGIFKSLVLNEAYGGSEDGASGLTGLQDYFDKMSSRENAEVAGNAKIAPKLISRISFAAILGCVLFDEWLFPDGIAPDDEIHDGVCNFIMEGLNVNPGRSR